MAEIRKITIEILNSPTVSKDEDEGKKTRDLTSKLSSKGKNKETKSKWDAVQSFIHYSISNASQVVSTAISTSQSRYFSLSENYIAENNYQNTMTAINRGKSLVSAISAGTITMGPIGGVVAGAGWIASNYFIERNAESSYYQNINATSMQTQFSRVRAGLVNGGKGTEN